MTSPRAVNDIIDNLSELDGQPLEVEGILFRESEGYQLLHYPKAERKAGPTVGEHTYKAAVWISPGNGSLRLNNDALSRWVGKRVRVHGILQSYTALEFHGFMGKGGFGPWGFWPAQIEPYSIQRVTAEERREHDA